MKEEKVGRGRNGAIYFNPDDPESVSEAIKQVSILSQLHGYEMGANEKGYKKGLIRGLIIGSVVSISLIAAVFLVAGRKKKE